MKPSAAGHGAFVISATFIVAAFVVSYRPAHPVAAALKVASDDSALAIPAGTVAAAVPAMAARVAAEPPPSSPDIAPSAPAADEFASSAPDSDLDAVADPAIPSAKYVVASADPTAPIGLPSVLGEPMMPPETPAQADDATPADTPIRPDPVNAVEILDECLDPKVCIDRYLWALYQRTLKQDAHIEHEQRKVVITTKKGKKRTVTRSFAKIVYEDFTWKDPSAAEKTGMDMMTYVIGGMNQGFKQKLFRALHAAADAGLQPGITSAFRDDYRQSIASGKKAVSNRSYHGGSTRGGYGHGLAADVVSVDGATRDARYASSMRLWKWLDAHGPDYGIARPYLDRDPPHFAPVDGEEYAKHRPSPKIEQATAQAKKPAPARKQVAAQSKKKNG